MAKSLLKRRSMSLEHVRAARELASALYAGGLIPNGVSKPDHLFARIVAGWEVGLSACQAVASVAIINGRPCLWGDGALGLVRASGLCAQHEERLLGDGEDAEGIAETTRVGERQRVATFSVNDAKRAKLWGKAGPWVQYPQRMLIMRARAWLLRDVYTDVLCGLGIAEEVLDWDVGTKEQKLDPGQVSDVVSEVAASRAPVSREMVSQIAAARGPYLAARGVDVRDARACVKAWSKVLATYQVGSAGDLSALQADELLAAMRANIDPSEVQRKEEPTAEAKKETAVVADVTNESKTEQTEQTPTSEPKNVL